MVNSYLSTQVYGSSDNKYRRSLELTAVVIMEFDGLMHRNYTIFPPWFLAIGVGWLVVIYTFAQDMWIIRYCEESKVVSFVISVKYIPRRRILLTKHTWVYPAPC